MLRLLILAALSVVLPALVEGQERNVYREVDFLGADIFLDYIDRAGLTDLLQNPDGWCHLRYSDERSFLRLWVLCCCGCDGGIRG